jgi:flagellar biosynthesis/type III secretory pathway protein FliH
MANYMAKDMAKDMTNKKHYPPAHYRYREDHPTISIVLTKELKNFLDSQKRDAAISYSQLVKKLVVQGCDLVKARNEAYAEGYTKGLNEGEERSKRERDKSSTISLGKCSCGKPLVFHLDNPEDLRILNQAISDSGVTHKGCPPKPIIVRMT